ncbi:MAG: hypothetical protein KC800_23200, partial [Candidatus Eremiobacteraeota bacterium]|nr:hypothetical protein [Candidatus Eremiobacteraeota bacterium]
EKLSKADRRRRDFFRKARERSGYEHDWYIAKRASKKALAFRTKGGVIRGLMGKFRVYEFEVKAHRIKEPLEVKKLDTFTICMAQDERFLWEHIKTHRPTQDKKLEPQPGAGYNPPLTEGLVAKAIDGKKKLALMLLDGSIIVGIPTNESLYSVLMRVPEIRGREILVYKHGMAGAKLLEDIKGL